MKQLYRPVFDVNNPRVDDPEVYFDQACGKRIVRIYDPETEKYTLELVPVASLYETRHEAQAVLIEWLGTVTAKLLKALATESQDLIDSRKSKQ